MLHTCVRKQSTFLFCKSIFKHKHSMYKCVCVRALKEESQLKARMITFAYSIPARIQPTHINKSVRTCEKKLNRAKKNHHEVKMNKPSAIRR